MSVASAASDVSDPLAPASFTHLAGMLKAFQSTPPGPSPQPAAAAVIHNSNPAPGPHVSRLQVGKSLQRQLQQQTPNARSGPYQGLGSMKWRLGPAIHKHPNRPVLSPNPKDEHKVKPTKLTSSTKPIKPKSALNEPNAGEFGTFAPDAVVVALFPFNSKREPDAIAMARPPAATVAMKLPVPPPPIGSPEWRKRGERTKQSLGQYNPAPPRRTCPGMCAQAGRMNCKPLDRHSAAPDPP